MASPFSFEAYKNESLCKNSKDEILKFSFFFYKFKEQILFQFSASHSYIFYYSAVARNFLSFEIASFVKILFYLDKVFSKVRVFVFQIFISLSSWPQEIKVFSKTMKSEI